MADNSNSSDDPSPMSDSDKIRAKRLAKMGGSSTNVSATSPGSSSSPTSTPAPAPKPAPLQPKPLLNAASPTVSKRKPFMAAKTSSSGAGPMEVDSVSPAKPSPTVHAAAKKHVDLFFNMEQTKWEHQTLVYIFQSDIDVTNAEAKGYRFLGSLVEELVSEGAMELALRADLLDRLVHARLSDPDNASIGAVPLFDYLVSCWKRCNEARKRVVQVQEKAAAGVLAKEELPRLEVLVKQRLEVILSAQQLVVSYSGLVLNPDMADSFPQPQEVSSLGASYLSKKLLLDMYESEEQLPRAFLEEFIARFDNDGLDEIIGPVVNSIVASMRTQNITTDYMTPIRAFTHLLSFKPIINIIVKLPNWCPPNQNARTIEFMTILGPFFAKSAVFPDHEGKIAQNFFSSADPFAENFENQDQEGIALGARNIGDVRSAQMSLRGTIASVQNSLYDMVMAIIKAGPEPKEAVLKYFSTAISLNHGRSKMRVDRNTVATDGFMFNICKVCLRLCDPFLDIQFSKLHLIDPFYFWRDPAQQRLQLPQGTTLMNAESEVLEAKSKEYQTANPALPPPNFISDVFALALGSHHFGLMSSLRYLASIAKNLGEVQRELARLKAERDSGAWSRSPDGPQKEFTYKRLQSQMDVYIAHKLLLEAPLLDRTSIEYTLRFYNLVMVWMFRVIMVGSRIVTPRAGSPDSIRWDRVCQGDVQGLPVAPLPVNPPALFATLPEFIFENIAEFYLFVSRYKPHYLEGFNRDEFLSLSLAMMKSSNYVKNPHLKSKLVEILFYFTLPLYRTPSGEPTGPRLHLIFFTHPLAKQHLVSAVTKYYVDCENTGASSAFYEKFNIRYNISQILKSVWEDPSHRSQIIDESKNVEEFMKFVNMLMNDTTYLLDESLTKLAEIHKIQDEMANVDAWNAMSDNERTERTGALDQYERMASSYVQLGNETLNMFHYLTAEEAVVVPFMAPYIVERLAAMLDYNLAALVGPKCTELKVKNPEKYRFKPKELLSQIIDIYLHLSHRPEFVQAVAKDGRSYSKQMFNRAVDISSRHALKNPSEIQALQDFVQKVEQVLQTQQVEEEELGDVPDEFLDPIMATVMEDPVILPTSNHTVDRATIITLLLSKPMDPFSRQNLTIDMVIPNTELKARIDAWKQRGGGRG